MAWNGLIKYVSGKWMFWVSVVYIDLVIGILIYIARYYRVHSVRVGQSLMAECLGQVSQEHKMSYYDLEVIVRTLVKSNLVCIVLVSKSYLTQKR